jgi:glycosidase
MIPDVHDWIAVEARKSLGRLTPRIEPLLKPAERPAFMKRLDTYFPVIFHLLYDLYGQQYDFFYHLEQIITAAAQFYSARPSDLKALDDAREAQPDWFQSENMVGGVCYVDLFAGNLKGIRAKIPYFQELGLTYLHLMPLFRAPEGESDGGYAVSSYREVNPSLGTMKDLAKLAAELRAVGISLVIDFVFNHTSNEHDWAKAALAGDETYQGYYYMFPDRTLPDEYERNLREIFPEQAPGSFTYRPEVNKWVWTTFHTYQWDLNYGSPTVFNAMLQEMLFLANHGVEILRLDAVAFIWKQMGTPCENLPQVHSIIRAYNALLRVAAPAMLFKSEAIVHPAEVATYISTEECQISYNPTLMALTWEALATREVRLLQHSMSKRFAIDPTCAWVNYVRSHDDIGWTFADEDAIELWINGFDHRQFLNRFYTGQFQGSFASGLPFNYNPVTLDMRISGTTASLTGLEQALDLRNSLYTDNATRRILLLYSVALSAGGIPLIYLGDEIGTRNDYRFEQDSAKASDSRWAHRPPFDWKAAARRADPKSVEGGIFLPLQRLIQIRKSTPALSNGRSIFFDTGNPRVFGYVRNNQLLVLANFSEREQLLSREALYSQWSIAGVPYDLISEQYVPNAPRLEPYQFMWLVSRG